jgi:hypothetical protein
MNEKQPIASGTGYSLPIPEKEKRLVRMARFASEIGFGVISTCACKNRVENIPQDSPLQLECHFHDKWF